MLSFNESIINFNKTILEFNGTMLNTTIVNENKKYGFSMALIIAIVCTCFMGFIFCYKIILNKIKEPIQATIDMIPLPETSHVVYVDYTEGYDFVPESTLVKIDEDNSNNVFIYLNNSVASIR